MNDPSACGAGTTGGYLPLRAPPDLSPLGYSTPPRAAGRPQVRVQLDELPRRMSSHFQQPLIAFAMEIHRPLTRMERAVLARASAATQPRWCNLSRRFLPRMHFLSNTCSQQLSIFLTSIVRYCHAVYCAQVCPASH